MKTKKIKKNHKIQLRYDKLTNESEIVNTYVQPRLVLKKEKSIILETLQELNKQFKSRKEVVCINKPPRRTEKEWRENEKHISHIFFETVKITPKIGDYWKTVERKPKPKRVLKKIKPIKIKSLSELSLRLHENNIKKQNLNRLTCVKDSTTGVVFRLPLKDAKRRMLKEKNLSFIAKEAYKEYWKKHQDTLEFTRNNDGTKRKIKKEWHDGLHIIPTQGSIKSTYGGRNRKTRRWFNVKKRKQIENCNVIQHVKTNYEKFEEKVVTHNLYYWKYEEYEFKGYTLLRKIGQGKEPVINIITGKINYYDRPFEFEWETIINIPIVKINKRTLFMNNPFTRHKCQLHGKIKTIKNRKRLLKTSTKIKTWKCPHK